jgi:hypothetical protein
MCNKLLRLLWIMESGTTVQTHIFKHFAVEPMHLAVTKKKQQARLLKPAETYTHLISYTRGKSAGKRGC